MNPSQISGLLLAATAFFRVSPLNAQNPPQPIASSPTEQTEQTTGELLLENFPPGAVVLIDGQEQARLPLVQPLRLTRGPHQVEILSSSSERFVSSVLIGEQPTTLSGPVAVPTTAPVEVITSTSPEPMTLFMDGRALGPVPYQGQMPLGEHQLWVRGATHGSQAVQVLVSSGQTARFRLDVAVLPADVTIDAQYPDVEIIVNGQLVGRGRWRGAFRPGYQQVRLLRAGYQPQLLEFNPQPGTTLTLTPLGPYAPVVTPPPPPPPPAFAQPAPIQAPPSPESEDSESEDYSGVYGALFVPVMLSSGTTHGWEDRCPLPSRMSVTLPNTAETISQELEGDCSAGAPVGGALALRLGYSFGWFGVDVLGAAMLDVSTAQMNIADLPASIPSEYGSLAGDNVYLRPGLGLGLGAHLATPGDTIRFTGGANFGFVQRWVFVAPDSYGGSSLSYTAPWLFLDGGVQLGSVPGGRLYLGVFLWWEFASDVKFTRDFSAVGLDASSLPDDFRTITPYRGTQFFFGPLIGLAFGY